ncbi:MAG: replicative DNA helicase [Phycisphaerales bacterium]
MPAPIANDFISQLASRGPGTGAGASGGAGSGEAPFPRRDRGPGAWNNQPREPIGKLFDREPPRALEAEMSLLGAMVLDPRVIGDAIQIIKGPEAFYDPRHGAIYQALIFVYDKFHSGDLVQIRQHLADRGVLDQVGGIEYLEQLASSVPVATNAPHFARIVAEKYKLRRLIEAAGQVLFDTYHAGSTRDEDASVIIDAAEARIFEIAQDEMSADPQDLHTLIEIEYDRLLAISQGRAAPDGVRCGLHDLDEKLGGFQPGEMIILAARPSMGKTALALNLAEQIALGTTGPRQNHADREPAPIGVFSLEMSKASLVQRLLSSYSGIDSDKIRRGNLHKSEHDALVADCDILGRAPMFIDDTPGLTLLQLRARARRMVQHHSVKALVVDYLQLLTAPASARESRQVEVSAISRGVKALARELKVPIICLSQLNRGPESRDQNRPRLSDLRESGSLEQDADVVLLLHREEYYHIGDEEWLNENPDKRGIAEIIIAKQRNGPTGSVNLTWDSNTTRFKNYAGATAPSWANDDRPPPARKPQSQPPGMAQQYPAVAPKVPAAAPPLPATLAFGTPAADPNLIEPRQAPRPGSAFHPGHATGPVENHRDGGGPDREEPDEPDEPEAGPAPF